MDICSILLKCISKKSQNWYWEHTSSTTIFSTDSTDEIQATVIKTSLLLFSLPSLSSWGLGSKMGLSEVSLELLTLCYSSLIESSGFPNIPLTKALFGAAFLLLSKTEF
ncbi:hypothetical protein KFK09_024462 [Dendrobium nobile]|uniref:Uncharacterized protein n=1 Tax=Dendrobium nobile TaxID=94219 RepID=A0A8T3ADW4_DENNO|nr:hypothetical protein KFK09_024462 [Dendrobium nobile]